MTRDDAKALAEAMRARTLNGQFAGVNVITWGDAAAFVKRWAEEHAAGASGEAPCPRCLLCPDHDTNSTSLPPSSPSPVGPQGNAGVRSVGAADDGREVGQGEAGATCATPHPCGKCGHEMTRLTLGPHEDDYVCVPCERPQAGATCATCGHLRDRHFAGKCQGHYAPCGCGGFSGTSAPQAQAGGVVVRKWGHAIWLGKASDELMHEHNAVVRDHARLKSEVHEWNDLYADMEDQRDAVVARLREVEEQLARATTVYARCSYCGHETARTPNEDDNKAALLDHMLVCPKRPETVLFERLEEVEADNERLRGEIATRPEYPQITGTRCPSCGGETLFVGKGGYLTCSLIGCKEPAFDDALKAERDAARREIDSLQTFKRGVDEALNRGDWGYRP